MSDTNPTLRFFSILLLGTLFHFIPLYSNNYLPTLKFRQLSVIDGLSSNEVQKIYQDREGYIWIATRNGLSQYDGYTIKNYRANSTQPDLLSNNNITSLVEDSDNRLWIGTINGLNVLDKTTGEIKHIDRKEFTNNTISEIIITRNDDLLLATDRGLYKYIYPQDSCIVYNKQNTGGILPQSSIKSLLEDSRGDLWIGTWNEGLYRYETESGKYYSYPKMNQRNSAHIIFEDSQKRIWVGTWDAGLNLLENIYNPRYTKWKYFRHDKNNPNTISDNTIYSISEDQNTQTLWIGTRSGLSILPMNNSSTFTNFYPNDSEHTISGNEVTSIIRDTQGMMWLGMIGAGVNGIITNTPSFNLNKLNRIKNEFTTSSIRSILVDDNEIYLGVGSYGLVIQDQDTENYQHYSKINEFATFGRMPTVLTIKKSPSTGKIWIGTYDGGIYIYDKTPQAAHKVTRLTHEDTPWLPSSCIYAIKEDTKENIWIGTRFGLSMLTSKGQGIRFDSIKVENKGMRSFVMTAIEEGPDGTIWIATNNYGIIKVSGEGNKPEDFTFKSYSIENNKLNSINTMCLHKDQKQRLWIGTEGGGLNIYDISTDRFLPVHEKWNLPGDDVYSIIEDHNENLWITTNVGLVHLIIPQDQEQPFYRLYTTSDGLQDNIFTRNAAYMTKDGKIYIAGHQGYNSFYPDQLTDHNSISPIVITDIKIFNQSWSKLQPEEKKVISTKAPGFTKKITLDHNHNNFSIEYASLSYTEPAQNKYAYQLEGFDPGWVHVNSDRRFAYYNNLAPGTYHFNLKASNSNGIWNKKTDSIQIVILPPPWKTWWAYTLYLICALTISIFIYRTARNRLQLRNALHLRELEQAKSEELNHAKLQFFTNITHELLTPLTIISATVDELKKTTGITPNSEHYQIMTNNINRLIRLLQQILEFRKAETGNLKLKVSKGDLSTFARNGVESIRPLMKKKMLHFSIVSHPEPFPAYFDPDKIDKILYNLLSNAAKYNNPGGTIWVELKMDETKSYALLTIKDNGKGMTKEAINTLFQRFYEGDYRKFNTIGTGIGLSLTKDLVTLHGGTISVESEEGKGTAFNVSIPITRDSYKEEEIDEEITIPSAPLLPAEEIEEKTKITPDKTYSLLLLEDNEELLNLMVKLLSTDYTIFTGMTGKEGLEIIEQETIDLVVSDVMMPEMDGIEFCKHIKQNFDTCHIPLILLTAKNREEDRVEAYDSGADAFISKPFNLSVLHSRIGNLLKSRERVTRDFKKQLVFEAQELNYTSIDEEFIQKAIQCVHNHLDDSEFGQKQFMEEMGASKSTLYRKLKSLTGLNSSAFIRNVRLKAACQIMEEKKHIRISELAYAVGFNDPKYFSACFKREFGMQPSEYISRFIAENQTTDNHETN